MHHNTINTVLYVTEKYIAWCVTYKCIIMTDLLDPLNPESNTSDLGRQLYAFYCFYLIFFPQTTVVKCQSLVDTEAKKQ